MGVAAPILAHLIVSGDQDAVAGYFDARAPSVHEYCSEVCPAGHVDEAVLGAFADFLGRARGAGSDVDLDDLLRRSARTAAASRMSPAAARDPVCRSMPELIAARANGELPHNEAPIKAHLEKCKICRQSAQRLVDAEDALIRPTADPPPAGVRAAWLLIAAPEAAPPDPVAAEPVAEALPERVAVKAPPPPEPVAAEPPPEPVAAEPAPEPPPQPKPVAAEPAPEAPPKPVAMSPLKPYIPKPKAPTEAVAAKPPIAQAVPAPEPAPEPRPEPAGTSPIKAWTPGAPAANRPTSPASPPLPKHSSESPLKAWTPTPRAAGQAAPQAAPPEPSPAAPEPPTPLRRLTAREAPAPPQSPPAPEPPAAQTETPPPEPPAAQAETPPAEPEPVRLRRRTGGLLSAARRAVSPNRQDD